MARITVFGGTGYAGAAIVAESAKRGHQVTAVSRSAPDDPLEGVDYVIGSVLDAAVLDQVVPGRDAVISALSPRGDMAGKVEGAILEVARRVDGTPTRLAHVGGASSLLIAPEGPRLWDVTKDHV
ncbi:MAG: NAD(P)H-binding protein, partial [Leifsonia sp.]